MTPMSAASLDPNALRDLFAQDGVSGEAELQALGTQFEAALMRQYLDSALKPMMAGSLDGGEGSNEIYRSLVTDILAESISQEGYFGFANLLQARLQVPPEAPPTTVQPPAAPPRDETAETDHELDPKL